MGRPAHSNRTAEFKDLDFARQASSITASINNLCNAIGHHVRNAKDRKVTQKKCVAQVERMLARLK